MIKKLPDHDEYYFWNPVRGGISVIVSETGEKPGTVSGVNFEKLVHGFLEGKGIKYCRG